MDEVCPPLLQETVALQIIRVQPVQLRCPQHADVEVGIAWSEEKEVRERGLSHDEIGLQTLSPSQLTASLAFCTVPSTISAFRLSASRLMN